MKQFKLEDCKIEGPIEHKIWPYTVLKGTWEKQNILAQIVKDSSEEENAWNDVLVKHYNNCALMLDHPFLHIPIHSWKRDQSYCFVLPETSISLVSHLVANPGSQVLSKYRKYTLAFQIARGIAYLHEKRVVAGNLNDTATEAKLHGFGLLAERRAKGLSQRYYAPEIYAQGENVTKYDTKNDVFCFGVFLYELFHEKKAFEDETMILNKNLPELEVDGPLADLIKMCWNYDPKRRPTMQYVLNYMQTNCVTMQGLLPNVRNKYIELFDAQEYQTCLYLANTFEDVDMVIELTKKNFEPAIESLLYRFSHCIDGKMATDIGYAYEYGSLATNLPKAVEWYRIGAKLGRSEAQNNLGACYMSGRGVYKKNTDIAVEWFLKAKASNPTNAYPDFNLGLCYKSGVARNLQLAMQHFQNAVQLGHPTAQQELDQVIALKNRNE